MQVILNICLPRDDLRLALRYDGRRAGMKTAWAVVFSLLCRRGLSHLRGRRAAGHDHGLAVTDRVIGLLQTGQMREAYVIEVLRRLRVPTAELYFHPAMARGDETLGPNPDDLAALLSPAVRQTIAARGLRLSSYSLLEKVG